LFKQLSFPDQLVSQTDTELKTTHTTPVKNYVDNQKNNLFKYLYFPYQLVSQTDTELKTTHTTPVKKYVDDQTFSFQTTTGGCSVQGYSTSETWYAVLDYGTNYCNLHNLITGKPFLGFSFSFVKVMHATQFNNGQAFTF
jgi:hypothetical protein